MKKNRKILIGVVAFIGVLAILAGVYKFTKPETEKGGKEISITVVNKAGKETEYDVHTDAEYLEGVMEDAKEEGLSYEGDDGEYGLMIHTVNGEKAVFETDGAYWGFFVNGDYCEYGVSEQPAADGDEFEIRYTINEQ